MQKRSIATVILIIYIAILFRVLVFKNVEFEMGGFQLSVRTQSGGQRNFLPFETIARYLRGQNGLLIAFINLGGNILLLFPLGLLLPIVFRHITWWKSLAFGVGTGLAIEVMQAILRVGVFDVDDVLLNALGVMIGYWTFSALIKRVLPA